MILAGNPIDFLVAFGAGILVSFTPCVYPLIPLTVGYIGASSSGSRLKGFLISLVYALGVAITYSVLGMVASLSGGIFGEIAASPVLYFILANVCIFFGLVVLEVFPFPFLHGGTVKIRPKGLVSTLVFGMVTGLAFGPCTAPALGSILVYVGTKQNMFYGAILLFCFAYGACATIILAGTFVGFLSNMPKPGRWLGWINKVYGFIFIGMGEYFLIKTGVYLL